MTEENLEQKLKKKREELRLKSINIQTKRIDSWDDYEYLKKHLSNVETEIYVPKLVNINITFNIRIAKNGRLIISPGTSLIIDQENIIDCRGQLTAKGYSNDADKIKLSSIVDSIYHPQRENSSVWDNLRNNLDRTLSHKVVYPSVIQVGGDSGYLDMEHCIIRGRGIDCGFSRMFLTYCDVNSFKRGIDIRNSDFNICGSNVSYNQEGGIHISKGTGTIYNNTIIGNRARYGGGIYIDNSNSIIFNLNKIKDNFADGALAFGGGMYLSNSNITGDNNTIENNQSSDGGGIYLRDSNFIGRNNLVQNNYARRNHGGVYRSGRSYHNCLELNNKP